MTSEDSHYFRQLLDGFCNRNLAEAELRDLDERLAHDPAARSEYLATMALQAELFATPVLMEVADEATCLTSGVVINSAPVAAPWRSWLAIAASLVAVAWGSSFLTQQFSPPARLAAVVPAPSTAAVAKVIGTRNCRWRAQAPPVEFGQTLTAGQRIELDGGLLELSFFNGARVILEGPAVFDVQTSNEVALIRGRMSAVAPSEGTSFAFGTPNLQITPGDGEFGLVANGKQGDEVHVFHGRIQARAAALTGAEAPALMLVSKEAVRVTPTSTTLARVTAHSESFVRSLSPGNGPHAGLYAQDRFEYPAGPLSGQNGGFGWAGPWEIVELDESETEPTNVVAEGSLSADQLLGLGGRAVQVGHRNRIRRGLGCTVGGVFDAAGLVENQDGQRLIGRSSRTVYVSFVQRVSRVNDGFYGLELHRGDGNPNRVLCVGNGAEGAPYGVTSNYNSLPTKDFPALGAENVTPNFLVVKIEYGADNRDQVTLYRNPRSRVNEAACLAGAKLVGNFAFDRVSIANFDGQKAHEIDEVRIGITYQAVTGEREGFGRELIAPLAFAPKFDFLAPDKFLFGSMWHSKK